MQIEGEDARVDSRYGAPSTRISHLTTVRRMIMDGREKEKVGPSIPDAYADQLG